MKYVKGVEYLDCVLVGPGAGPSIEDGTDIFAGGNVFLSGARMQARRVNGFEADRNLQIPETQAPRGPDYSFEASMRRWGCRRSAWF